jgi:hypothetical protein
MSSAENHTRKVLSAVESGAPGPGARFPSFVQARLDVFMTSFLL